MEAGGLGHLIREARLRRGWTQEELASRLGVKDSYVSQWETGARKWPGDYIRPLAALLGLDQVQMAVAAGLIDPPADMPKIEPLADPRLRAIARRLPDLEEDELRHVERVIALHDAVAQGVIAPKAIGWVVGRGIGTDGLAK